MEQGVEPSPIRPAEVCGRLILALGATDGRRRKRKRNTTPDAIGLGIKRALLERAVADDPEPDAFDGWLLERCAEAGVASGPTHAMALDILAEWQMALATPHFREWLDAGAPSDDATE